MECPDCKATLTRHTKFCGCGWRYSTDAPAAAVSCAHQDCSLPAMCKIKVKTGWANLCAKHYDRHFADEAHANLDKHGLAKLPDETNAEHVGRMREFVKSGVRRMVAR